MPEVLVAMEIRHVLGRQMRPLLLETALSKRGGLLVVPLAFGLVAGWAVSVPALRVPSLVAAMVLCVASLWLVSPDVTVLAYVAARPLVDLTVYREFFGLTVGQVWGAGLLVLCVLYLVLALRRPVPLGLGSHGTVAPFLLIVAFACLALPRSGADIALVQWLRLSAWILLALVVARMASSEVGRRRVETAMLVFGVLLVAVAGYLEVTGRFGSAYYARRYSMIEPFESLGQGPHGIAFAAVLVMPFCLARILRRERTGTAAALGACLAFVVALSYVRSAQLGLLCVAVGFVFAAGRSPFFKVRAWAWAVPLLGAAAVYIGGTGLLSRFLRIWAALRGQESITIATSGRLDFWEAVLRHVVDEPLRLLLGDGALATRTVIGMNTGINVWAHNDYLEMLATGGIVLLTAYVALLMWLFRPAVQLAHDVRVPREARDFGLLVAWGVVAYMVISGLNGVAFSIASIGMACLVGEAYGLASSVRGQTCGAPLELRAEPGISRTGGGTQRVVP